MTAAVDPVSGPLSREELRALAAAPHGQAVKVIRKHDPLFGRQEGEKIEWSVEYTAEIKGYATVMATSLKEAEKEADNLEVANISWHEFEISNSDISDVEVKPT